MKRLFEYSKAPDALATIKSLPTQYTAAEVQFLLKKRCFEPAFVRRIIVALRVSQFSDARLVERAVVYFRLGNPGLRRNRPTIIDRATECRWWITQLERTLALPPSRLPA
jgi:hypothetical protein